MRGLFAAGDMMGNISGDIGAAAVYGWIAGHHAADCQSRALPSADPENAGERMAFYSGIYERRGGAAGASWQEANFALQQIMTEYADWRSAPCAFRHHAQRRDQVSGETCA